MTRYADQSRSLRLDPESQSGGYFRHAVYNHWDPYEDIPESLLEQDRERLMAADDDEISEAAFDDLRQSVALFGAGEEAVTEDLAPLMLVLESIDDQMFLSSQIYEEAKHTQFFDRYWRDVIDPVAEHHGMEVTAPTDERYFMPAYEQLFDDTEAAMHKLLEPGEDTPENRVRAYCHYHLTVESVLAQTGYYGLTNALSDSNVEITQPEAPDLELDGLVEGISYIRSDEGRHVGFGMHKVQQHLAEDGVDEQVVRSTLQELMPHVAGIVSYSDELVDPIPLVEYAREKLTRRIEIITNADAEIPDVEELVKLDDGSGTDPATATDDD
jgi:ribonucleoside-diphosphate reductase beta chain